MSNKTVKMPSGENKEEAKLSYDELQNFAYQLSEQAKQLKKAVTDRDSMIKKLKDNVEAISNVFTRMNFLIEVIKHSNVKFDEEFALQCVEEFKNLMVIPESKEESEDTNDNSENKKE